MRKRPGGVESDIADAASDAAHHLSNSASAFSAPVFELLVHRVGKVDGFENTAWGLFGLHAVYFFTPAARFSVQMLLPRTLGSACAPVRTLRSLRPQRQPPH